MNGEAAASRDDDPLGPVVESFLDRFRRGERPALTDLVVRHPDLAAQIRELIPALVELEQLGGSPANDTRPPLGHRPGVTAAGRNAPPPDRLGDYRILREVGDGGMGVVYEAEHQSLRSRVALKVMHPRFRTDPKFLRRFHAEARLAAGLHHTNIVGVFDYGQQDGVCYYAMQFIEGQPLDLVLADLHRLRDEGPRPDGPRAAGTAIGRLSAAAPSIAMSDAVRGLLTGHFAAPARSETAMMASDASVPATGAGPALEPDPNGTAQAVAAEAGLDQPAQPAASTLGSRSLGGSSELRYFREIARVGAQVADALQYAHKRGVLHRDIKPSNLLLDALGNVWVTDFGLAKLEEGDDLTQSHELVGTLRYMAPERFRGTSDRRGDVYSLGATLYELVTLRPPFEESDQIRLIERIRDQAPAPPRQLDRTVPRDLETIVLKAMARDASDRFGSAGELADELRRFVEGRPIRSRPVSAAERFVRWCKRDPRLASTSIASALLTIILAASSTWAALVYRGQEAATRKNLFASLVAQARGTRFSRRRGQRFDSLKTLRVAAGIARELGLPPEDFDRLRDEAIACMVLPDLEPTGQVFAMPPNLVDFAFDLAMTRYALRRRDWTIEVRRIADDRQIAHFRIPVRADFQTTVFRLSPDGRYVAACDLGEDAVTIWDVDRNVLALNLPGFTWVRFSPDSRRIVVDRGGEHLLVYDLTTGQPLPRWRATAPARWCIFRPDGIRIAGVHDRRCRVLDAESGRLLQDFPLRADAVWMAWSPDGATLATACEDRKVDLWDVATGVRKGSFESPAITGLNVAFHPAGTLLATNGSENRLWLWDAVLCRPWLSLTGGSITEFGRDGRMVVTADQRFTVYRVDPAREYRTLAHPSGERLEYHSSSVRHDGRVLALGTSRGVVLWDLARGAELAVLPIGLTRKVLFEASGDLLTNGSTGVRRWPVRLDSGGREFRIGPPCRLPLPPGVGLAEDRSGRIVALAGRDFVFVATPEGTVPVGPLDGIIPVDLDWQYHQSPVAVSPDGEWLAIGGDLGTGGSVRVWSVRDAVEVTDRPRGEATRATVGPEGKWLVKDLPIVGGPRVAFSPDGKWLMTSGGRLWEVGTWREAPPIKDGSRFSPDGRLLLAVGTDRVLGLVETATGRTLARLESPGLCGVSEMVFSPNGSRLVVTTNDGPAVHIWDLRAIRKNLSRLGLDWDAPAFPPDDPADPSRSSLPVPSVDLTPSPRSWRPGRGFYESLIARVEAMLAHHPDPLRMRGVLAGYCNDFAWGLTNGPASARDLRRGLALARRAVALAPGQPKFVETLGIVLCRTGHDAEAIPPLERSLAARRGGFDTEALFCLAMAHHRLGHRDRARQDFDRAVRRMRERKFLDPERDRELEMLRAAAESVLAGPAGELPADVFAPR